MPRLCVRYAFYVLMLYALLRRYHHDNTIAAGYMPRYAMPCCRFVTRQKIAFITLRCYALSDGATPRER